jgi:hypothetical protein
MDIIMIEKLLTKSRQLSSGQKKGIFMIIKSVCHMPIPFKKNF